MFSFSEKNQYSLILVPSRIYLVSVDGVASIPFTPDVAARTAITSGDWEVQNGNFVVLHKTVIVGPFSPSSPLQLTQILLREISRANETVADMKDLAIKEGIDLSEPKRMEPKKKLENVSTVNPNVRSKKIQKGFAR